MPLMNLLGGTGWRFAALVLLLSGALFITAVGCGPQNPKYQITEASGIVLHDGHPLECGTVVLESRSTGLSACGVINPDGTFTIGKVAAGEYLVAITAPELPPPGSGIAPTPVSEENRKLFNKYMNAEKSGLTATVTPDGNNTFRFNLK